MSPKGSGFWAGELDGLVGRDAVLATLRDLLDTGSRTAVVTGIPGAGKTSVLRAAARAAASEGLRVLPLTCHESDREIPYGVLVDLLMLAPDAEDLLEHVLRTPDASGPPDPLRLRLGVLDRLDALTVDRPVLVVVDDAQWADPTSLSVLEFAAHRLAGTDVSFLVSTREAGGPLPFHGHRLVPLPALDDADARRLLRRSGLALDQLSLPSVVDQAAGNPLALLELARSAAGTDQALPSTVEASFGRQVAALPARTRDVLLLAAAGDGDLGVLDRALTGRRLVDDLAPAEAAGVASVTGRHVRFVHPLARTAAYAEASTAERLRAHERLANVYVDDPDRQVQHRAAASVVPDEEVAFELAEASARAERRGAVTEAARLVLRASELSPGRTERDERALAGLALSSQAGHFESVLRDAARLRAETHDDGVRAKAAQLHAYALTQVGREAEARLALLDQLDALRTVEPYWGWSSLSTLAVLSYRSGSDMDVVREWLHRYEVGYAGRESVFPEVAVAARAWVVAQIDPLARPADVLALIEEAPVLAPEQPLAVAATQEMLLGAAAWLLDETATALLRLQRAVELMRRADAPGEMTQTLMALALVQHAVGDYDGTDESGRMVLDLAEARNQTYASVDGLEIRSRVAGIRGEVERARDLCGRVLLMLPVGGAVALEANIRVTMSWVHLAERDHAASWEQVRWLFHEDGRPRHVHVSYRELAHYVSSAARAGATETVGPVLRQAECRLAAAGPRHRLQLAAAQAVVAGEDAEPFHVAAVTDPVAARWPFDLANARLEYGIWLRRRYRQVEARHQLQAALDTFVRLGTPAWEELARAELRAAGVVTEEPERSAWADLTSQEREVVRLAAAGRTNPEIAAALYLSPRTVSTHLYNAFPKLGVTSRAQLRDVVPAATSR